MKIRGIYKIVSPTGKIYIGQSKDCFNRNLNYRHNQIKNQHKVYASIKKYGWDKHSFEIIKECSDNDIDYWEVYFISHFKSYGTPFGMNLTVGGGGTRGAKHSLEAKRKISEGNKNKVISTKTREQISKTLSGIKHSDERKENISKSLTGRKATEEHRRNMSIGLKGKSLGKKRTPEHIANKIKNHPSRRMVLNTQTGIFYFDCKEAAASIGRNYKTVRNWLLGYNKRITTDFIYV